MYIATNTHILVAEFDYVEPTTLEEVFWHLSEHGPQARLIAGGTDLLVQMKMERKNPACLISLARVLELQGMTSNSGLTVGATASIRSLARSEPIGRHYTALAEACNAFSTIPIMVMATLGGNLCNASPAADTAPPLLAFDASVALVSRAGQRVVPLEDFFLGPGQTALRHDEVLRSVHLAESVRGAGSAFVKVARVAADISQVCAAVRVVRDGDHVIDCRIALGAVAPTPVRAHRAEAFLTGQRPDRGRVDDAARIAGEDTKPITDVRATQEYRRHASRVIVRDALTTAWLRAGGRELK
ncbi:MAG: FAD binding domain-containing protein [Candidatus Rokubacteria bacterium]|nr:FAD binding domain-containing protein [Candidatus Rokubacteria bacterium]